MFSDVRDAAPPTGISWSTSLPVKAISPTSPKQRKPDQAAPQSGPALAAELVILQRYDLREFFKPTQFFAAADRFLVTSASGWKILGLDGLTVAERKTGPTAIHFDGLSRRFITLDSSGLIHFHDLVNGRLTREVSLKSNGVHALHLGRCSDSLIVSGRRTDPAGVETAFLESMSIREPFPGREPEAPITLTLEMPDAIVAVTPHSIYVASRDRIVALGPNLQPYDLIQGDFVPVSFTVDGNGWIYLITDGFDERLLSLLTPQAQRAMQYRVLPPANRGSLPPIVGSSHQAYVMGGNRILCVDQTGNLQWTRTTEGNPTAATVSADDTLIVSDANEVAAFDREGQRGILFRFADESLLGAAPVLMDDGSVLVCGRQHVYRLGVA